MKIKDRAKTWPPPLVGAGDHVAEPASEDVIFSARKDAGTAGQISLKVCQPDGTEYMATLELPESALVKALILIIAEKNLTLEQVGELEIS